MTPEPNKPQCRRAHDRSEPPGHPAKTAASVCRAGPAVDLNLTLLLALLGYGNVLLETPWVVFAMTALGAWLGGELAVRNAAIQQYQDFAKVSNDLLWKLITGAVLLICTGSWRKFSSWASASSGEPCFRQHPIWRCSTRPSLLAARFAISNCPSSFLPGSRRAGCASTGFRS